MSIDLIGSGVFLHRDTVILGLRREQSVDFDTNGLVFDLRVPIADSLRLNPRIAVAVRDYSTNETRIVTARPMLRMLYHWRRHFRLELEIGGEWRDRELPDHLLGPPADGDSDESAAYYVNMGYWMDF